MYKKIIAFVVFAVGFCGPMIAMDDRDKSIESDGRRNERHILAKQRTELFKAINLHLDGDIVAVRRILETTPGVGIADPETFYTPLCWAAYNGQQEIVELLLLHGVPVDDPGYDGNTALLCALINKHENIAQLLVLRGANINHENKFGASVSLFASASFKEFLRDKQQAATKKNAPTEKSCCSVQ